MCEYTSSLSWVLIKVWYHFCLFFFLQNVVVCDRHKAKNTAKTKPAHIRTGKKKAATAVTSDDEYNKTKKPDFKDDSYYFDDEDDFHSSRNKV